MPQITLYIPKSMDESWRAAPQPEREAITKAMRSLLRRKLAQTATHNGTKPSRASEGQ